MTSPSMSTSASAVPPAAVDRTPNVPRATFKVLAVVITGWVAVSGLLYVAWVLTGFDESPINELYHVFDVAGEFNGGAWLNAGLWLLLAVATAAVAAQTRKRRVSWVLFSVIAAYASLDEFAMLHERLFRLGARLAQFLPFDPFSYRWVIAGLLLASVAVIVLTPLMLALPRKVLLGYVIAGFIFLLGAVVLETIGGYVEQHFGGVGTWHLKLLMHFEEWLEMLGVALAIATTTAMLRWRRTDGALSIEFGGYRRSSEEVVSR